jgi:DNA repair exonuclease SbcCD ATPase subunit
VIDLDELALRAARRRRELDAKQGEARALVSRIRSLREEVEILSTDVTELEQVTHLLNTIAEDKQLRAQQDIEELVSRGLQTIFDDSLSFHIVQSARGKTSIVEFIVRTTLADSVVETPVMDARGGGLAAVIGFLLRVVVMLLRGGTRQENLLLLDETFAMVSAEYLPVLGEFLRSIVEETGIQIVMVTHQTEFIDSADKVYRFSQEDGKTRVVST